MSDPPKLFSQPIPKMSSLQPTKTALRNRLKIGWNNGTISRSAYTGLLRLVEFTNSKLKLKDISKKVTIALTDKHIITNTKDLNQMSSFEISARAHPHTNRGNLYEQHTLTPLADFNELETFKTANQTKIRNFIQRQLQAKGAIKVWAQLAIDGRMRGESCPLYCGYEAQRILVSGDITGFINTMFEAFQRKMDGTSYFEAERITRLDLHVAPYTPLTGARKANLPDWLANKKALINIDNKDDRCLEWALLSAMYPAEKDGQETYKYKKHLGELDFRTIQFPVAVKDIARVEEYNNIKINLYGVEENSKKIFPLHPSKPHVGTDFIPLLIYEGHYMWIKNWNRLVSTQGANKHICPICIGHSCNSQENLNKHMETCAKFDAVRTKMPDEGTTISFKNNAHSNRVPVVVYADFESICVGLESKGENTEKYQEQKPASCRWRIKLADGVEIPSLETDGDYVGTDVVKVFVKAMRDLSAKCFPFFKEPPFKRVEWDGDKEAYDNATECAYCKLPFSMDKVPHKDDPTKFYFPKKKVPDHDHLTGRFRMALHQDCNFKAGRNEYERFIPVVFHNLRGYDAHHILRELAQDAEPDEIDCIANTSEKYLSFTIKKPQTVPLRFIDSVQFMPSSLEELIKNNRADPKAVHTAMDELPEIIRETKGTFPYDWFDSLEKLKHTAVPSKLDFFNKLSNKHVDDDDYDTIKRVWCETNCQTWKDYHDWYLKADVFGLCDVFESFRNLSLKTYGLDPCYYYGAPGLAWDAMLKHTGVTLDLLTDQDMYMFFERGIRGGISVQSHRYYKAERDTSHILYTDANNLYGWAMCRNLPQDNFEWIPQPTLDSYLHNPDTIPENCTLQVDFETPEELHDYFNEYPPAETMTINESMISPKSRELLQGNAFIEGKKLCGTLLPKKDYVIHAEKLKRLIAQGHRLTKVSKGVSYRATDWMRPYIELNTSLRSKCITDFEKDFYKLMNNSVFGKTMENVRKYSNFKLVRTDKFQKYVNRADFKRAINFGEHLSGIDRRTTEVKLNKPVYVGQAVLDLSKLLMNQLHYDVMKSQFGERAKLLMTDTDSLVYGIESSDITTELSNIKEHFDFSNYPKYHPLYDDSHKAQVGLLKDEEGGRTIEEFVGHRAKVYAYHVTNGCHACSNKGCKILGAHTHDKSKAKGISKSVVKSELKFDVYKRVLETNITDYRIVRTLTSNKHRIYAQATNKKALSAYDDKRWILEDGITTRAYGHYLNRE